MTSFLRRLKKQTDSSLFCFFPFQERLSYIGPEEFVQAFVQKDPLDNAKVTSECTAADKKTHTVVMQPWLRWCSSDLIVWVRSETAQFLLQTDHEFTQHTLTHTDWGGCSGQSEGR